MPNASIRDPTAVILFFDPTIDNEPTRRDFGRLQDDAVWGFLCPPTNNATNQSLDNCHHPLDKIRKRRIEQFIDVIQQNGHEKPRANGRILSIFDFNDIFYQNYGIEPFNNGMFLSAIFGTHIRCKDKGATNFFAQNCGQVFRIEPIDKDGQVVGIHYAYEDYQALPQNIFISSRPIINAETKCNIKLADKVFEILPEQRKMHLEELMSKLVASKDYKEIKEKHPDAPDLEPVKFIGFLAMYWPDVFCISREAGEVYVKRQVLHHQKPSQERKNAVELLETRENYPLPSNLLSGKHVVSFFNAFSPSDGFFLRFLELKEDLLYVEEELSLLYNEFMRCTSETEREPYRLHKNNIFDGTCCLAMLRDDVFATDDEGDRRLKSQHPSTDPTGRNSCFRRVKVTGQSNGQAMVQCVDYPYIGIVSLKCIFKIPAYLLGMRQTGVYAVVKGCQMATKIECEHWKGAVDTLYRDDVRLVAQFYRAASRAEYSGRRKFAIFTATISVNEFGLARPTVIPNW